MTMTEPEGAASTKCWSGFDLSGCETGTIWGQLAERASQLTSTVKAGPAMRVSPSSNLGEYIFRSGIRPPCGTPSLTRASAI